MPGLAIALTMSPELVFFGVRSLARLGTAAKAAYDQKVRDEDAKVRLPDKLTVDPFQFSLGVLSEIAPQRFADGGDLRDCLDAAGVPNDDPESRARIVRAAEEYWPAEQWSDRKALLVGDGERLEREPAGANGYMTLRQWAKGTEPPGAFARIGVALADIALDFASTNSRVFGAGANGEKLIAAVALNLRVLLPDPDKPLDWEGEFAERATVAFFEAGLRALSENVDAIVDEEHLSSLAKGAIPPMVSLFEETRVNDPGKLPALFEIRDTLFGPMAKSAIQSVLQHQTAFLGSDFDPEKGVGAATKAILLAAAEDDLRRLYSKEGLLKIYSSVLGVIAERPELFIKGDGNDVELASDMVAKFAATFKDAPPPFGGTLAADLVADAVTVLGAHASKRFDQTDPWEAVAAASLASVVEGFKQGIGVGAGLTGAISRDRLREVVKIMLTQAAKTPGMITGKDANSELQNIAAAVASLLAHPDTDLLSQDAWRDVIAAALTEAANNPATLFSLDTNAKPESHLAVQVISDLLKASASALGAHRDRRLGVVLFGETLRDAATDVLRESARNAAAFATEEGRKAAAALAERLNALARDKAGSIGAREWLWLYRRYIAFVIEKGDVPQWSNDELIAMLYVDDAQAAAGPGS